MGKHIRHDAVLAAISIEPRTGPFVPGGLEELQECRIVHGKQRHVGMLLGVDDSRPDFGERGKDRLCTCTTSVPGVRTPTKISPPGSCSRQRSLQTTGIASPTERP